MKAQVYNGILVAITASRIGNSSDIESAITTIHAHSIEDGQEVFAPLNQTLAVDLIELKMWEMNVTIIAVGSQYTNSSKNIYGLKFNLFQKNLPKTFNQIQRLGDHLCPRELSWAPRLKPILYMSSVCSQDSIDNHVYEIDIDYVNPVKSLIARTYTLGAIKDFRICAQSRMINIIDLKKPQIFSFDSESTTYTKIFLPLADYNITSIVRHTCDQDNNVLQVIGCTANPNDCKLITYRADLAHKPYNRVHSVVNIPAAEG